MLLLKAERIVVNCKEELARIETECAKKIAGAREDLRIAIERRNMLCAGLDLQRVERAERVISVDGEYVNAGSDRGDALEAAIADILLGGRELFKGYAGTKSYAHWHGQDISFCEYGRSPSHGCVIFRIGLTDEIQRLGVKLTAEQIDDAIYYLRNLEAIQRCGKRGLEG